MASGPLLSNGNALPIVASLRSVPDFAIASLPRTISTVTISRNDKIRMSDLPKVRLKADWPAVVAGLALLPAMLWLSRDFGSTWDERALQKLGEQLWDFYTGKIPRSGIDISFGYTRMYGLLMEFLSVAAQHVVHADIWIVRHAVNAVFGWAGIVV